eukprot:313222-Prorocentrum_minimum.AAC.4
MLRLRTVNKYFEYMTGYQTHEIIGKNCRFLQSRGPYSTEKHGLVDTVACSKISTSLIEATESTTDILNFNKDGTPIYVTLSLFPLFGDRHQPNLVRSHHYCT